jgi:hypothetical protein
MDSWIIVLDWIFLVQSNPIILLISNKNPKIHLFWIFDIERGMNIQLFCWAFGVRFSMDVQSANQSKIRKKVERGKLCEFVLEKNT